MRVICLICLSVFLIVGGLLFAAAPPDNPSELGVNDAQKVDNTTFINANKILMFVTNHGNFGRDLSGVFGFDYGTFYPYVSTADIQNGNLTHSVLYAAGLWIGGKVNGQTRIAMSEYDSEFIPGPFSGNAWESYRFHVYKLHQDSLAGNPNQDYLDWPADHGAPIDEYGDPVVRGDQMLWSVYNDGDPYQHDNNAGGTLPLDIEVQQSTWALDQNGNFSIVIPEPVIVSSISGTAVNARVEVIDPFALTGHEYSITAEEDPILGPVWNLTDETLGQIILADQTTWNFNNATITDGFLVLVRLRDTRLKSIQVVSNAGGTLDPPVSGALPVIGLSSSEPDETQQLGDGKWAISSSSQPCSTYQEFVDNISPWYSQQSVNPYDYEIRFTGGYANPGVGGSYAANLYWDSPLWVPFELWRTGINTPNDPSDDVRLIPVAVDYDDDDTFELRNVDHLSHADANDPYTETMYWQLPDDTSAGETGYNTAVSEMFAGTFESALERSVISRMVFINVDGGPSPPYTQDLPEQGTVFRITSDTSAVSDTLSFHTNVGTVANLTTGPLGQSIYTEYKVINKSTDVIEDCYLSLWTDPDIGGLSDDKVTCDPSQNIFIAYNGAPSDDRYGGLVPAVGFKFMETPKAPSPGSLARVDGKLVPDQQALGLTSLARYINGTDPDDFVETYCYMQGLTKQCQLYISPASGLPTPFMHAGDPVQGTGDIDDTLADKRMMGSTGPFTLNPNDTATLTVKMSVAQGDNYLESVSLVTDVLNFEPGQPMVAATASEDEQLLPVARQTSTIYVGNLPFGRSVDVVDLSSLAVNGSVAPASAGILPSHPAFNGKVIALEVDNVAMARTYLDRSQTQTVPYTVWLEDTNGQAYEAVGNIELVVISTGDVDGDGGIDISDLTALVNHLFGSSPAPINLAAANINCDVNGDVDVSDLTRLVNHLFVDQAPLEPCDPE